MWHPLIRAKKVFREKKRRKAKEPGLENNPKDLAGAEKYRRAVYSYLELEGHEKKTFLSYFDLMERLKSEDPVKAGKVLSPEEMAEYLAIHYEHEPLKKLLFWTLGSVWEASPPGEGFALEMEDGSKYVFHKEPAPVESGTQ